MVVFPVRYNAAPPYQVAGEQLKLRKSAREEPVTIEDQQCFHLGAQIVRSIDKSRIDKHMETSSE